MQSNLSRHRLGFHLIGLARRWRRHLDERLAAAGLSDASWVPLVHLQEHGDGMQQKDLALAVGLDSSSLVRLLDLLEAKGWIERRADAGDRRAKRIHLTADGHATVKCIRSTLGGIEEALLSDIGDAELRTTLSVITRIDQRLKTGGGA